MTTQLSVRAAAVDDASAPSRQSRISRFGYVAVLGGILLAQALQALALMRANTVFLDEATYITGGHELIGVWLHGGPNMHYDSYFSGAPFIYPVVAALVDGAGGLLAARLLSLGFMLLTTLLVYATGQRIYGRTAGLFAAATFVTVAGTQFLSAFATYDAMALALTVLAAWMVVRATDRSDRAFSDGMYLAAPVLVLANFTKYATAAYDPIILGLAFVLVARHAAWRDACRASLSLLALITALISAGLALLGSDYLHALMSTTVARPAAHDSASLVLGDSLEWVGAVTVLALVSVMWLMTNALRRSESWPEVALVGFLASAVLIAPLDQWHIHTVVSLSKHVTFGAWFGALAVGLLLATITRTRSGKGLRLATVLALLIGLFIAGLHQSRELFEGWPNSTAVVAELKPLVSANAEPVLADDSEALAYYLGGSAHPTRWVDTFHFRYRSPVDGRQLVDVPAYVRAIEDGYFGVIAIDYGSQRQVDAAVTAAVHANPNYRFVADVRSRDIFGVSTYVIWQNTGGH